MLVLSRQRDETIMIGDEIEITVVDIRGDKIRLGISAPARIAVHRKEVYESIRKENEQAARLAGEELIPLAGEPPGVSPGPRRLRVRPASVTGLSSPKAAGAAGQVRANARSPDPWALRKAG
ncbi:MAG: carbon storage regulator CsrA [Phycisphaerae bacterium]|nr:carbon storage regulator CsrA [Phycisphaerae bacterium]